MGRQTMRPGNFQGMALARYAKTNSVRGRQGVIVKLHRRIRDTGPCVPIVLQYAMMGRKKGHGAFVYKVVEDSHGDGHCHYGLPQEHLLKWAENRDCSLSSPLGENIKHNGEDQDNTLDDLLPK